MGLFSPFDGTHILESRRKERRKKIWRNCQPHCFVNSRCYAYSKTAHNHRRKVCDSIMGFGTSMMASVRAEKILFCVLLHCISIRQAHRERVASSEWAMAWKPSQKRIYYIENDTHTQTAPFRIKLFFIPSNIWKMLSMLFVSFDFHVPHSFPIKHFESSFIVNIISKIRWHLNLC